MKEINYLRHTREELIKIHREKGYELQRVITFGKQYEEWQVFKISKNTRILLYVI